MKMNKYFMLGLAGLAFAACSNEEDAITNGNPTVSEGNGVVSVRIVKPAVTKAMTTPNGDSKVEISGDITVTLAGNGYSETIVIASDELSKSTRLKFWNVPNPEGMTLTASINGGVNNYNQTDIADGLWEVAPSDAPAYGETTDFTPTGTQDSPVMDNDNIVTDGVTNNGTEAGASSDDEDRNYDMYQASVTMAIPLARLEVGKISFVAPEEGSIYSSIIYSGCYMNGYATNGGAYSEDDAVFSSVAPGSFSMRFEQGTETGVTISDLKYAADNSHEFISTPINGNEGDCNAFNFYASSTNPHFTLYFQTGSVVDNSRKFPRYAYIKNYYEEGTETPITLQNGHIYQIKDVILSDDNILGDPDNALYGVDVTVTEATWTVETISAGWAEQQ